MAELFKVIEEHEDHYKRTVQIAGIRYQTTITITERQSATPHVSLTADALDDSDTPTVRLECPALDLHAWQDFLTTTFGLGLGPPPPSTTPPPAVQPPPEPAVEHRDDDHASSDQQPVAQEHRDADRQSDPAASMPVGLYPDAVSAWQPGDTQRLRELWSQRSEMTLQTIAEALGRSPEAVLQRLRDLGLLTDSGVAPDDGQGAPDRDEDEFEPPPEPGRGDPFP